MSATKLGRWCLPSSPLYRNRCNQMLKGTLADCDNSTWPRPPIGAEPKSCAELGPSSPQTPRSTTSHPAQDAVGRDALTALIAQFHG
tara:strand:- start:1237 stop:1497 length:261 start_codon:yes stop_codon:yes gene_type:complete